MPKRAIKTKRSKVVSFRVSLDVLQSLEKYASNQRNHIGHKMSASEAARHLFKKVLEEVLPTPSDPNKKPSG